MSALAPIRLTLYNPETDEVIREYTRSFIPWELLKRALRLQKVLNTDEINESDLDELAGLVVAVFGDQFTVEQLNNGADMGEMLAVINAIVSRASQLIQGSPNPTIAAAARNR
jgi:hypothetical protein